MDCDECVPAHLRRSLSSYPASTTLASAVPLVVTFTVVMVVVQRRLYPVLCGRVGTKQATATAAKAATKNQRLPTSTADLKLRQSEDAQSGAFGADRLARWVCASTIGFAAVLAELLLCEISNRLNPATRHVALRGVVVPSILLLLIGLTPVLEVHILLRSAGWRFGRGTRVAWTLEAVGFGLWVLGFWWIGHRLPGTHGSAHSVVEACLERVGVVGISLLAVLSGFASVSSAWQTFAPANRMRRKRRVSADDVARKRAGLEATEEMLQSKQSRLRALEARPGTDSRGGVWGFLRGKSEDTIEASTLRMEVSGLETMQDSLSDAVVELEDRYAEHQRAGTPRGVLAAVGGYGFAVYCVWRICSIGLGLVGGVLGGGAGGERGRGGGQTDPVNVVLTLLLRHWDATLDRTTWMTQISFALSFGVLAMSFTSVLATLRFLGRLIPGRSAQGKLVPRGTGLALAVAQICATYVIASALLLRGSLPGEMRQRVEEALGMRVDQSAVQGGAGGAGAGAGAGAGVLEGWFERWFIAACAVTGVCIWVGERLEEDDTVAE